MISSLQPSSQQSQQSTSQQSSLDGGDSDDDEIDPDDDEDADLTFAQTMMDGEIVASTRRNYNSKIKQLRDYLSTLTPALMLELPLTSNHPLTTNLILAFLGYMGGNEKGGLHRSPVTLAGHQSAIIHIFKEADRKSGGIITIPADLKARFYNGLRLEGKVSLFEGKQFLSFTGYRMLAEILIKNTIGHQSIFGWSFLLVQFNLIARSTSCGTIL